MNAKNQTIAFWTIFRKEAVRILRIWIQTLLPPVITMSLYFVIFGKLIGSQISDIGGFTYMQYIVPGLIMMSVITNAYMNTSGSFFGNKFQKSVEELLVSPTPYWIVILGYVCGGVFRSLLVGAIVMAVSLFFTKLYVFNIAFVLIFAALTAFVFSLAGLLNGVYAKKFDDVSIIPTFVLTPLTYLGGVFYSIALLPPLWQFASKFNPILYMVNGFRYGFLGVSDVNVYIALGILVIFAGLFFIWNLILFRKGAGMKH